MKKSGLSVLLLALVAVGTALAAVPPPHRHYYSEDIPPEERISCPLPGSVNLTEENCLKYHCKWDKRNDKTPPCYMTRDEFGYVIEGYTEGDRDHYVYLRYDGSKNSPFVHNVIKHVVLEVTYVTENIIRFKLKDRYNERYEVPVQKNFNLINKLPDIDRKNLQYAPFFKPTKNGHFSFTIHRTDGRVLFDSSLGNLILTKYFLQISTRLPSKNLYGFGENPHDSFRHNFTHETSVIFSRDNGPNEGVPNMYSAHPYYECVEEDGRAHSVLFLNSHAVEYTAMPAPGLTLTAIGGVLDFIMFVGDDPEHATKLYHQVIGRTFMPPYWALGYQQSKFGYFNTANLSNTIDRTINQAQFPMDVQHIDIDYMQNYMDFTYDQTNFKGLPDLMREWQKKGLKFVAMLDPAIIANASGPAPYPDAFLDGARKKVFIQWDPKIEVEDRKLPEVAAAGEFNDIMYGHVWPPGPVAFPDFFKESARQWWIEQISYFRNKNNISFDAIWIDMNEPSEFATNPWPETLCGDRLPDSKCWRLHCPVNEYDDPEYPTLAVTNNGPKARLRDRTLCMSAVQGENNEFHHYDVHNLYGHTEGIATQMAAQKATGKRSFVLARSTYPSSGHYMGHWLGDNASVWKNMHGSVIGMLEFNLFGIPYVGADICGFAGSTTEEMCVRWYQVGAFSPFCRNHNIYDARDQDPAVWSQEAQLVMKEAMRFRYTLLPYLYTLFYKSHTQGGTVVKPLFHEYPKDPNTYGIDTQFMWGPAFLISPILFEGQKRLDYYVPEDIWYDVPSGSDMSSKGETRTLSNITLTTAIPILLRGGHIIPSQIIVNNTEERFSHPISLTVAPSNGRAEGELFWDDGDSMDTVEKGEYEHYTFTLNECKLEITQTHSNKGPSNIRLGYISLLNTLEPTSVTVDGTPIDMKNVSSYGKIVNIFMNTELKNLSSQHPTMTVEWNTNGKCEA